MLLQPWSRDVASADVPQMTFTEVAAPPVSHDQNRCFLCTNTPQIGHRRRPCFVLTLLSPPRVRQTAEGEFHLDQDGGKELNIRLLARAAALMLTHGVMLKVSNHLCVHVDSGQMCGVAPLGHVYQNCNVT